MTDPIADMITRIRNAQATHKSSVLIPLSKHKLQLAKILVREGYIVSVEKEEHAFPMLRVVLKYNQQQKPVIKKIKRVSKPGRRVYASHHQIPYVLNELGMAILSTSEGLKTSQEARREKIGGEILCEIY